MPVAKLIVADDQTLFREALVAVLEQEAEWAVVGQAAHLDEIGRLVTQRRPDLLVSEIRWNGHDRFAAFRSLVARHPRVKLVFLSAIVSDWHAEQARRLGARAYRSKSGSVDQTLAAIRAVLVGRVSFADPITTGFDANGEATAGG